MRPLYPNSDASILREYNHAHDRLGKFATTQGTAGGDSGGGPSGPASGGVQPNKNSMWHGPNRTIAHLKGRLAFYKGAYGNQGQYDTENPEKRQSVQQHMADISDAIAMKQAGAKARKEAGAAKAMAIGPAMHRGVALTPEHLATQNLGDLASIISSDWRKQGTGVNYAAKPYLEALHSMDKISDNYMADSGSSVVAYFLGNATSWRGPVAKAVKAELNRRLKGK